MADLKKTGVLTVRRGTKSPGLININPNETTCIDFYTTTEKFNLYLVIDDFIQGNSKWVAVTITQVNNCEMGAVFVDNGLFKDIGSPRRVVLFRKDQNIYFKPVADQG